MSPLSAYPQLSKSPITAPHSSYNTHFIPAKPEPGGRVEGKNLMFAGYHCLRWVVVVKGSPMVLKAKAIIFLNKSIKKRNKKTVTLFLSTPNIPPLLALSFIPTNISLFLQSFIYCPLQAVPKTGAEKGYTPTSDERCFAQSCGPCIALGSDKCG